MPNLPLFATVCVLLATFSEGYSPQEIKNQLDDIKQLLSYSSKETKEQLDEIKKLLKKNLEEKDLCSKDVSNVIDEEEKTLVCFTEENLPKNGSKKNKLAIWKELKDEDITALRKIGFDVKANFDNFLRSYPNGKMTWKDFEGMMTKAQPQGQNDGVKMGEHMFRMYDSNKDCYTDFTEFLYLMHIMGSGTADEVFTRIYRVFDMNMDLLVTMKEMTSLMKDMYGLHNSEENKVAADKLATKAFAEMDKNKNGKVTKDEFVTAIKGQEEVSKMLTLKIMEIFLDDNDDTRRKQLGL